ncbi:MAG: hypothetical protein AAGE03_16455 [Pseudomonadota bacterium]
MSVEVWLGLLSAFGLGSVVTACAQWFFSTRLARRERQYAERKEAYIGLLEAWVRQEVELENALDPHSNFSRASELDVGHWVLRTSMVASPSVAKSLNAWSDATPGSPERGAATEALKDSMRKDLSSF